MSKTCAMQNAERVVFRTEKDPFMPWLTKYVAAFPEDLATTGNIAYVSFYFNDDGRAVFEPYSEMDSSYYYKKTKLVHKNSAEAQKCLEAVTAYYANLNAVFVVAEKLGIFRR